MMISLCCTRWWMHRIATCFLFVVALVLSRVVCTTFLVKLAPKFRQFFLAFWSQKTTINAKYPSKLTHFSDFSSCRHVCWQRDKSNSRRDTRNHSTQLCGDNLSQYSTAWCVCFFYYLSHIAHVFNSFRCVFHRISPTNRTFLNF